VYQGWKECPRCGIEVKNDEDYCPECGWIFYNKRCPRCGKYMPDYAKVCFDCGWYFYWEREIGEDDEDYYEGDSYEYYEEDDEPVEDYPDMLEFWNSEIGTDFEDENELGQYLDDLGY
jgi:RNA polymerase subunit RPABC4/transcription elongation factor Spt4